MLTIILLLLIDYILGCVVLAAVDNEDQRLFRWASSEPLFYPFVVLLWFVVLFFIWYRNHEK